MSRLSAEELLAQCEDGEDGELRGRSQGTEPSSRLEVVAFDLYRTVLHGTEVIRSLELSERERFYA